MNELVDKFKLIVLAVSLGVSLTAHADFSPDQVQQIITTAAKIQFTDQTGNPLDSKTVEAIAEKALLEAVADPDRVLEITKAFVAANPNAAAAIAYAVAKVFPESAVKIVTTAIAAAPSTSTTAITKAAVIAAPAEMAKITAAAVAAAPQLASDIVKVVVGVAVISPSHVFAQSESTTSNSAVKQNAITNALESTLKSCTDDSCKIAAAVAAMSQGGSSPDLAGSLAGEIIRAVIAINPNLQTEIIDIVENKKPVSPN